MIMDFFFESCVQVVIRSLTLTLKCYFCAREEENTKFCLILFLDLEKASRSFQLVHDGSA